MQPEAQAILDVFRRRGIYSGGFIQFTDFGEAITWKDGSIRDDRVRQAFVALVDGGFVVELLNGLQLTERGEEQLYGSTPKHGARVYRVGDRIVVKQVVLRGTPPEYVIDEDRERLVSAGNDEAIAAAVRDAVNGRL